MPGWKRGSELLGMLQALCIHSPIVKICTAVQTKTKLCQLWTFQVLQSLEEFSSLILSEHEGNPNLHSAGYTSFFQSDSLLF